MKERCKYDFPHPWEIGQIHVVKKSKENTIRAYCSYWAKAKKIKLSVFKERKTGYYSITRKE